MIRFDNITDQVDGVRDVFTTQHVFIPGTLVLGYNGQVYPKGVNIQGVVSANQFRTSFVPAADTDALMVVYQDGNEIDEDIVASSLPPRTII